MEELVVLLGRESLNLAGAVSLPVLIVGMTVGLVVGALQTATQIQDQTIAFVVKLLAMATSVAVFLPWALAKLAEFSTTLYENIPETIGASF